MLFVCTTTGAVCMDEFSPRAATVMSEAQALAGGEALVIDGRSNARARMSSDHSVRGVLGMNL